MKNPHHRNTQGFTLLESIITMAISAMVMMLLTSLVLLLSRITAQSEEAALARRELREAKQTILQALSREDSIGFADRIPENRTVQLDLRETAQSADFLLREVQALSLKTVTHIRYKRHGSLLRVTLTCSISGKTEELTFLYHFHTWRG